MTQSLPIPDAPGRLEPDTPLWALARSVAADGDRILVDFAEGSFSFREVDRRSTRMANALRTLNVEPGQCVTTMLDNNIDVFSTWLAINKLDAIWVPMNTAFKREFLRHQINDSEAKIVICEQVYLPRVVEIAAELPLCTRILVRNPDGAFPPCPIPIESLDAYRGTDDTPIATASGPADLACLIYTSGTTGPSKGCMISHNYLCNFARHIYEGMPFGDDDVVWTSCPLFHANGIAGNAVLGIKYGVRLAFAERFSLSGFWNEIEASGATMVNLIGSTIPLLCGAPENPAERRCHGQVRGVWGGPISAHSNTVMRERFGVGYVNPYNYGQTEGCKISTLLYGEPPGPLDSVGHVHEDFDVRIFDDEDNPVPPGVDGEIVYRPNRRNIMFEGYWRRPEETLKVWRGLWMHSGDIGRLDEHGNLYFVDRKKDYMRRGGENVSSMELEITFMQHPAIQEVAVHAVPSDLAEDEIKATIVLHEGVSASEEEICRWSMDRLPYFAVPRFVEFRATLPRNPVGRILKFQLRDEGCTATTWDMRKAGLKVQR